MEDFQVEFGRFLENLSQRKGLRYLPFQKEAIEPISYLHLEPYLIFPEDAFLRRLRSADNAMHFINTTKFVNDEDVKIGKDFLKDVNELSKQQACGFQDKVQSASNSAVRAGQILWHLVVLSLHPQVKEPSLEAVQNFLCLTNKGKRGYSIRSLKSDWASHKSVAHFWAGYLMAKEIHGTSSTLCQSHLHEILANSLFIFYLSQQVKTRRGQTTFLSSKPWVLTSDDYDFILQNEPRRFHIPQLDGLYQEMKDVLGRKSL